MGLSTKVPVQRPNHIPFEQVTLNQIKRSIIAECTTAAATANKTATVTNFADFELIPGMDILVYFKAANTANNITLSINDSNAYPIKALGTADQLGNGSIKAGAYKKLTFTGDSFITEAPTISVMNSESALPLNSAAVSTELSSKYYNKQSVDEKISDALTYQLSSDCNACIPSEKNRTQVYVLRLGASNLPTAIATADVTTIIESKYSFDTRNGLYRITQDLTSLTNPVVKYTRRGYSTNNGTAWSWNDWQRLVTESDILNLTTYKYGNDGISPNDGICQEIITKYNATGNYNTFYGSSQAGQEGYYRGYKHSTYGEGTLISRGKFYFFLIQNGTITIRKIMELMF